MLVFMVGKTQFVNGETTQLIRNVNTVSYMMQVDTNPTNYLEKRLLNVTYMMMPQGKAIQSLAAVDGRGISSSMSMAARQHTHHVREP